MLYFCVLTNPHFCMFRGIFLFIGLFYSSSFYCWGQTTGSVVRDSSFERHSEGRAISPKKAAIIADSSNPTLPIAHFLGGVRFAIIDMTEPEQKQIDASGSIFLKNFADYLKGLGIEQTAYTTAAKKDLLSKIPSLCDVVKVQVKSTYLKSIFNDHHILFESCLGDTFSFSSNENIYNDQFLIDKMFTLWETMYAQKSVYNAKNKLQLHTRPTTWQQASLQNYLMISTDPVEGIYERLMLDNAKDATRYVIALVKNPDNNGYNALYISGASNHADWLPYEIIAEITPSATQNLFPVKWYLPDKSLDDNVYMSADAIGVLHFSFSKGDDAETRKYFKTFPKRNIADISPMATGSGVAISKLGYIVTNYHVVEGGTVFEVQGKQNGVVKTYNATLVRQDVASDLAILKINSFDFKELPELPFSLRTSLAAKGEEVFTLGYPLSKQLGAEVKYTTGNISSESGFQGDVSCYQTSVAVHPGNSGGGLFDTQGNLVGFVRAKLADSETITYAIKARNVLNLIDLLPERINLPEKNTLQGKPITEQIAALENFVFFIRVYN
jgi:S1-C subfamily serine protease